jgi:hypothetical protein
VQILQQLVAELPKLIILSSYYQYLANFLHITLDNARAVLIFCNMVKSPDKQRCEFLVCHQDSKPRQCCNSAVTQENGKFLCTHHKHKPKKDLSTPVVGPLTIKGMITKKKQWIVNEALKYYEERTETNLNDLLTAITQLRDLKAMQRNTDTLIPNCREF